MIGSVMISGFEMTSVLLLLVLNVLLQLLQNGDLMNVWYYVYQWCCVFAAGAARYKQYSSRSYSAHGYVLPHRHLLWRGLILKSDMPFMFYLVLF